MYRYISIKYDALEIYRDKNKKIIKIRKAYENLDKNFINDRIEYKKQFLKNNKDFIEVEVIKLFIIPKIKLASSLTYIIKDILLRKLMVSEFKKDILIDNIVLTNDFNKKEWVNLNNGKRKYIKRNKIYFKYLTTANKTRSMFNITELDMDDKHNKETILRGWDYDKYYKRANNEWYKIKNTIISSIVSGIVIAFVSKILEG